MHKYWLLAVISVDVLMQFCTTNNGNINYYRWYMFRATEDHCLHWRCKSRWRPDDNAGLDRVLLKFKPSKSSQCSQSWVNWNQVFMFNSADVSIHWHKEFIATHFYPRDTVLVWY